MQLKVQKKKKKKKFEIATVTAYKIHTHELNFLFSNLANIKLLFAFEFFHSKIFNVLI